MTTTQRPTGSLLPRTLVGALLRLEGLAILGAAIALYANLGHSWPLFALLLLAPDLAALGYLVNRRVGGLWYNMAHNIVAPLLIAMLGGLLASPLSLQLALIWLAHIGMDRAVGYGLKYNDSPWHTHLSEG